ncbi:phosphotransferase, partial [Azospirillum brasilense]|nr:phosphotransferase [Azospirillum brasilense]
MATLGQRTAELHCALAKRTGDPAFDPEPVTADDLKGWGEAARRQAEAAFAALPGALDRLAPTVREQAESLLARRADVMNRLAELADTPPQGDKTRIHGDYHLGQVLRAQNDWYIIDFEGEPAKSLEERRAKHSPLRDVAGMLRSFNYATWAALFRIDETGALEEAGAVMEAALDWERRSMQSFLEAYRAAMAACPDVPDGTATDRRLLALFLMEKALYEIAYEAANRPNWIGIPVKGVLGLLDGES